VKEKLQQYALIAEIIGGIAIVASLIFVGMEIRQNAEVSRVNAYQELIAQITLINTLRVQDPEFAELYARFATGGQPQNATERARLEGFLYMVFRHGDLAWRQYEAGFLDRDELLSVLAPMRIFLNTELGQEVWGRLEELIDPAFVAFIAEVGLVCTQYSSRGDEC
jgi:hypothetical protein